MSAFNTLFDSVTKGMMALFGPWSEHSEPVSWSIDGPIDLLRVRAVHGSIVVHCGDHDGVLVRALKTVHGPTDQLAEWFTGRVDARISHHAGSVRAQTLYPRPPLGCSVFVRYEIFLPWAVDVDLFTQSGGIVVSGVEGAVQAETRTGNIELADTSGPATAHTASGHITASGVDGALQVDNGRGRVSLKGCSGRAQIRTTRGDIGIDGFDGAVRARSYQGAIRLDGGTGGAELETDSGDVLATMTNLVSPSSFLARTGSVDVRVAALRGYLEAESSDGEVRVRLPSDASGMLDAGTDDGTVHCALPVKTSQRTASLLVGALGTGYGSLVKLRSFAGDIHITQE